MKYNPSLHKLSNGITVILDPMDIETVSVKVCFQTGMRDEKPNEYGLTHFCEHMLCKGTKKLPNKKAIDDYMDYNGATRNAGTGQTEIAFYGRVLAENVNVLVDFFADALQNSLFDEKKIEIERNVICDERRRALDQPGNQFGDFISENLFNYTIFSIRGIGSEENIRSFTRNQMLEFIARRFSAKNCIICLSGRLDNPSEVLKNIERGFAFLPTHDVSQNTDITYTPTIAHNSVAGKNNVKLKIVFPGIWSNRLEHKFNKICCRRFERFMNEKILNVLRQENGLVYGGGLTVLGNETFEVRGFETETSAENIKKVVALIAKNAYDIYNNLDITAEDLDRDNRIDKLGDANWLESSIARRDTLISEYKLYGQLYDYYEAVRLFEKITPADVYKYSRGYFDGQMSIVTQGADYDADLKAVWDENFR